MIIPGKEQNLLGWWEGREREIQGREEGIKSSR